MDIAKTVKNIIAKINAGVHAIKETLISSNGKKKYEKAANVLNIAISALTKVVEKVPGMKDSYKIEKTIDCIEQGRDFFVNLYEQIGDFLSALDEKLEEIKNKIN